MLKTNKQARKKKKVSKAKTCQKLKKATQIFFFH